MATKERNPYLELCLGELFTINEGIVFIFVTQLFFCVVIINVLEIKCKILKKLMSFCSFYKIVVLIKNC